MDNNYIHIYFLLFSKSSTTLSFSLPENPKFRPNNNEKKQCWLCVIITSVFINRGLYSPDIRVSLTHFHLWSWSIQKKSHFSIRGSVFPPLYFLLPTSIDSSSSDQAGAHLCCWSLLKWLYYSLFLSPLLSGLTYANKLPSF